MSVGLGLAAIASACAVTPPLLLTTEDKPPRQMMVDGKLTGISVEKIRLLMEQAQLPYSIHMMPWARAFLIAKEQADACVFSMARTPEREAQFQWVGPLTFSNWVLYARSPIKLSKLEDARPLRIGTYLRDARENYLRNLGFKTDPSETNANNIAKLMTGHIDLWAEDQDEGTRLIAEAGKTGQVVPVLTFKQVGIYLGCNPKTSAATLKILNKTFGKLAGSGKFKEIDQRFADWQPAK